MKALHKVLVVDDDPVVGKSFDRVLSGKGYAVITARDGEEALRKIDAEEYDVVFTDIKMPGISGLEVAERVKTRRPWLPVVIVTGYGTPEHEARAEAAGVAGFLHKPLSPETIADSARKALLEKATPAPAPRAESAAPAIVAPAATEPEVERKGVLHFLKNVGLFLAAPFVGLAYAIAFPFIGLGMLAWMGGRALLKHDAPRKLAVAARNVALCIAAPVIGLVYVLLSPFIGLAMVIWFGARALVKRGSE